MTKDSTRSLASILRRSEKTTTDTTGTDTIGSSVRSRRRKAVTTAAGLLLLAATATANAAGPSSLFDRAGTGSDRSIAASNTMVLRSGSKGQAVKDLQRDLNRNGHHLTVDGIFGPETEVAVTAFQRAHRLTADGVVGPETRAALVAADYNNRSSTGYFLEFDKNWENPQDSRLSLVHDGKGVKSYRAGSGVGVTDECASNRGWLPDGTYRVEGHETHHDSSKIKGHAIRLQDKTCRPKAGHQAVTRGALYIHSEMRSDGTQAPDTPHHDDPWRWDGDTDYKSAGCIKLSPENIKDLFNRLDQAKWPALTLHVR
ncbi:peptidoglycan-binding protein [Kitasatospora sp. NPDC088391]|uniref:L,D-transpeptidase family protein n=1 Tax=Kitasatospora sp. NPDC088391 TaxID=3364074 RepID=UPI00380B5D8C